MVDLVKLEAVRLSFIDLLDVLSSSWPAGDIAEVREDIDYGEYGLALENMIAIAEHYGRTFDDRQTETVLALATSMKMLGSPWVAKLRQLT
jgi:hypothetical protein